LRESEEKYRELVEGSPNTIVVYTEGKIVFANRSSLTLMRASNVDELIEKPVMEFVHPAHKEFVIKRMTEMIKSGEAAPLTEEIFLRLDGSEVDVEVKALPITYNKKLAIQFWLPDNGVGIPENDVKRLFKIEERISTQGTNGELSTGLGLMLCKEFVEKNGGKIWVESKENIGSTFYFTLPKVN
jgi:PAS domain S-box-containing protein